MNKVSFVKDINTNELHSVVIFNDLFAKAIPVSQDSDIWAHWLNDSRANFQDVKNVLDVHLQQEAPIEITGKSLANLAKILPTDTYSELEDRLEDENLIQVGENHPTMGSRYVAKGVQRQMFDSTNLRATRISAVPADQRQNLLNYKARQFRTEQRTSALRIQVKRVRAIFDPNVGPGGGWRCPEGTMYGGQITDRFGRGCGGGLTRRLGRALMRAGRRLDNFGAGRDSRRLARRVQRAAGRVERRERIRAGRVRVANRLDDAAARLVGDFRPPGGGIRERRRRIADGLDRAAERVEQPRSRRRRLVEPGGIGAGGESPNGRRAQNFEILPGGERGRRWRDMSDDDLRAALDENDPARFNDPDSKERISANRDNIRREIDRRMRQPRERQRPADEGRARRRERQTQRLRRPGEGVRRPTRENETPSDPFDFIEDPKKREVVREALGEYADDIADLIRSRRRGERRRRGENAPGGRERPSGRGGEQQDEEDRKSLVQRILEALAKAFRAFQEARENRRQGREERRDNRRARRVRLADALDSAANRILDEEAPSPRRRRGDRDSAERRRVNRRAIEVADSLGVNDPNDDPALRRQYAEERGIPNDLSKLNDKELETILEVLDSEEREARRDPEGFDPFRKVRRENRRNLRAEVRRRGNGGDGQPARTPTTGELDGSRPDERSLRNVRNRFPQRGLPRRAAWRDREREGWNERDQNEMDRRFGRYYDADGNINDRGKYVNAKLRDERNRQGRPLSVDERENIVENADQEFDNRENGPDAGNAPEPQPPRPPRARRAGGDIGQRGLPRRASWRNRNAARYNADNERNMDDRFGRYYDANGNLNDRGQFVNGRLRDERNRQGRALTVDERRSVEEGANNDFDNKSPDTPESRVRTSELEGSRPDERSLRNVRNQFRTRGLPSRPYWRNQNDSRYSSAREREMDRRFGRYYDANGDLNARGRYVNQRLADERQAQGGQLNGDDVQRVIEQADNQFDRNNPINVRAIDNIDVNEALDDSIVNKPANDIRTEMEALHADIQQEARLDLGAENTPVAVARAERRVDEYIAQQRLAIAKLRANEAGTLQLDDAEKQRLVDFVYMLQPGLAPLLGDGDIFADGIFGGDRDWVPVGGGVARLGILDPRFDGEPRRAYMRSRYGALAALDDGYRTRSFRGLEEIVKLHDELGVAIPANLRGRDDLQAGELVELGSRLGMKSINPQDIRRDALLMTGLDITQMKNMALMHRNLKRSHERRAVALRAVQTARDVDELRIAFNALHDADREGTGAVLNMYLDFNNIRQRGLQPNQTQFLTGLDNEIARLGDPLSLIHVDRIALAERNPMLNRDTALRAQEEGFDRLIHSLRVDPRIQSEFRSPEDRQAYRELLNDIVRGNRSAAVDNFLGLTNRAVDRRGRELLRRQYAGDAILQAVAANPAVRDKMISKLREYNAVLNLPNDDIPGVNAAKNVRRADDAANGVVDRYNDTEVPSVMNQIINDAKIARRERLARLVEATYGDASIVPWEKRRQLVGEPPINPDNIQEKAQNWTRLSAEERADIKSFLETMYTVKYENDGVLYETASVSIQPENGSFAVSGVIRATGPNGISREVGRFTRYIGYDGNRRNSRSLYSSYLGITNMDMATGRRVGYSNDRRLVYQDTGTLVPEDALLTRNNGFATAFNNHAWGFARDAGFTQVNVNAGLDDGPYVWGRVGYRTASDTANQRLWTEAKSQVTAFRQGRNSIIKNEKQAQLVEYLAEQARSQNYAWASAPDRMELIYALEHSPGNTSPKNREREVRNWVQAHLSMGAGTISLANWDISTGRDSKVNPLTGNPISAPLDPRLGDVADPAIIPGDIPVPRIIRNGQITSSSQAVEFLRSGGSLNEVPNEFWLDAMAGNASTAEMDQTTMFRRIIPPEGAIGTTEIFVLRNADGTPSQQGWVIKASKPASSGEGLQDDTWSEVVGWNLAQAIGLSPQGAMYAGIDSNGRQRVVIPLASNVAPVGTTLTRRGNRAWNAALARGAEDAGYPARLLHLYQNFFLAARDRNWGNGVSYVDQNNRLYAVALDYARIGNSPYNTLENYVAGAFSLDQTVLTELRDKQRRMSAEARRESKERILQQYDEMVTRLTGAIAGGRDDFIRRMTVGAGDNVRLPVGMTNLVQTRADRIGKIYDVLSERLSRAREHRDALEGYL